MCEKSDCAVMLVVPFSGAFDFVNKQFLCNPHGCRLPGMSTLLSSSAGRQIGGSRVHFSGLKHGSVMTLSLRPNEFQPMYCPFCKAQDTKVVDSRLVAEGEQVRRRRECLQCGERFTTYEGAELVMPRIVKQNGNREAFDETKLRAGLQRALEKRPVSVEDVEAALARIKQSLRATGERELPSRRLGEVVMNELRELDQVAYVRFASVYRSFQDLNEFRSEIDRLEKKRTK